MGLFDRFLKKGFKVYAPLQGKNIKLKDVSDPTFADEILGKGTAIRPENGNVYAPFDGEVVFVANTKHALSLVSEDGKVELLVHVGLDTVKLDGKGFDVKVNNGDKFKKGDLLMVADLDFISKEGYDTVTPVIVCNSDAFKSVNALKEGSPVSNSDEILDLQ